MNEEKPLKLTPSFAKEVLADYRLDREAGRPGRFEDEAIDYLAALILKNGGYTQEKLDAMSSTEYTPPQVAEMMEVTLQAVHVWIKTGQLHGYKSSPRRWRIKGRELLLFLASFK